MNPAIFASCAALAVLALSAFPTTAHADFIDHFATLDDIGPAKSPSTGESRILVITIEVEGFEPLDLDGIRTYFSPDPIAGEPTFTDFYERMSLGRFRPVGEVLDPIRFETCPLPEDYFGFEQCRIPRGGGPTTDDKLESLQVGLALLEDIVQRVDEELDLDFNAFDINGPEEMPDGWVDGVLLLHNINFGGIALPVHFLRTEPLEVDGVKIPIIGISETPNVALHEFGHLLGWADLYDESSQTQGLQYSHMGSWNYEEPPQTLDAFSRATAGWTEPMLVKEGESLTDVRLPPAGDSGFSVQLGEGEEYFLLENRGSVGDDYLDAGIEGRGLAIYHVNLSRFPVATTGQWAIRLLNCLNCEPWAPMLMNEQADGKYELQFPTGRRDDAGDLFHPGDSFVPAKNTFPLSNDNRIFSSNRYDGAATGVSVTNIRFDGDDILVDVSVQEPCEALDCSPRVCQEGRCVAGDAPQEPEMDGEPEVDGEPEDDSAPKTTSHSAGCTVAVAPGQREGAPWMVVLLGMFLVWRRRSAVRERGQAADIRDL